MSRFLWRFFFILTFAALTAGSVVLWLSPDPFYHAQEFLALGRYQSFDASIRAAAARHGVDPLLVKAVVWCESRFHPDKVGGAGERGLMQITEPAASDWAKAEKMETFVPTDLFDAKTNLDAGVWYLAKALERWKAKDDPVPFALAEYNAGRTRVDRWLAATNMGEQATADDFLAAIDFPGTRRYIADIMGRHRYYRTRAEQRDVE